MIGAFVLLLLLVQTPFIYSIECDQVSQPNYDTCMQIKALNLTDLEKEIIISNLDYQNKFFPDHEYVYNRNTRLLIIEPPAGIGKQQGIFIKDAWMSLFTLMPSVLYNNSLFVPNKTQVLTGFNYRIQVPNNYEGSGYPNSDQGDCKRTYTLTKNKSENKIYVDNNYQGSGKLVNINISSDSNVKAVFNVEVAYSIDHYYWQRYCARYRNGVCVSYRYRCSYNYNEILADNIQIEDSKQVKYYHNSLFAKLDTFSSYSGNTNFNLNFSNSLNLKFQDSFYSFKEFVYSINYSKAPYYVLTLRADDYKQEQLTNLYKNRDNLIVKNTNNCSMEAFDFFNYLKTSCFAEQKPIEFKIETDKLKYSLNETIKVSIYPQNISVNVSYGNQSKVAIGNTSFYSEALKNKIVAYNGSYSAERVIYVQEQDRFGIIYNFSIFGLINYILYAVLRKCFGGWI